MVFEYIISQIAVVVFGVTAVLAISHKGTDLFGVLFLGFITALGGGTIRDLILDVPVFWTNDLLYVYTALGGSFAAFLFFRVFSKSSSYLLMLYLDGLGVALFSVQALHKTWALNIGVPLVPIFMGVITSIGGSIIRDVVAGRVNLLMRRELYANPILLGCIADACLLSWGFSVHCAGIVGILVCFIIRAAAIHWNLTIPSFLMLKSDTGGKTISIKTSDIVPPKDFK